MSDIRANTISDAAGTGPITLTGQYAAKHWVNFNGTGTVAIRDSFNASSLTDGGVGIYTLAFINDYANINWTAFVTGEWDNAMGLDGSGVSSVSSVNLISGTYTLSLSDSAHYMNSGFGDLA